MTATGYRHVGDWGVAPPIIKSQLSHHLFQKYSGNERVPDITVSPGNTSTKQKAHTNVTMHMHTYAHLLRLKGEVDLDFGTAAQDVSKKCSSQAHAISHI